MRYDRLLTAALLVAILISGPCNAGALFCKRLSGMSATEVGFQESIDIRAKAELAAQNGTFIYMRHIDIGTLNDINRRSLVRAAAYKTEVVIDYAKSEKRPMHSVVEELVNELGGRPFEDSGASYVYLYTNSPRIESLSEGSHSKGVALQLDGADLRDTLAGHGRTIELLLEQLAPDLVISEGFSVQPKFLSEYAPTTKSAIVVGRDLRFTNSPEVTIVETPDVPEGSASITQLPTRVTIYSGDSNRGVNVPTPKFEFFGLERSSLRRKITDVIGGKGPLLVYSTALDVPTGTLISGRPTARAFDHTRQHHAKHMENFQQALAWKPRGDRTLVFDLLPRTKQEMQLLGVSGSVRAWTKASDALAKATTSNAEVVAEPTAAKLLDALKSGDYDTIVVSGHATRDTLMFPDGTSVKVADLMTIAPRIQDGAIPPLFMLLACNSGRADRPAGSTLAQALLYRGFASAVVAPVKQVSPLSVIREIYEPVIMKGISIRRLVEDLPDPWQLYVEQVIKTHANDLGS